MCLKIDNTISLPKVDEDGYYKGYKVIYPNNYSILRGYLYQMGLNQSSRKNVNLYTSEKNYKLIDLGFHLFLNYKSAKILASYQKSGAKVIEVYFKQEDIVATGKWSSYRNVVVTKLLVKSLEEVRK